MKELRLRGIRSSATVVELGLPNPKTLPSYQTESLENGVMFLVCRNKTLKGETGQCPPVRIQISALEENRCKSKHRAWHIVGKHSKHRA